MRGRSFCFLVCLCVAMFGSAQASTITYTIVFTGTPGSLNDNLPFSGEVNARGSFTLTFDPTLMCNDATSGFVENLRT